MPDKKVTRRSFLKKAGGILSAAALLTAGIKIKDKTKNTKLVWQIDPFKCIQCGRCATECVLNPTAVKCVHSYPVCGYCEFCFGFFKPGRGSLDTSAENQTCPVGAINRRFVEYPYHEYTINEKLCYGCGKCVKGCNTFGNGSLFLQIRHDRCVNCNECSIATKCPSNAFVRVPVDTPYILKAKT